MGGSSGRSAQSAPNFQHTRHHPNHHDRDALLRGGFGAAVLGLAVGSVAAAPVRPAQAFPFGGGDDVASGLDEVARARAKVEEGESFFFVGRVMIH